MALKEVPLSERERERALRERETLIGTDGGEVGGAERGAPLVLEVDDHAVGPDLSWSESEGVNWGWGGRGGNE